jgi:flagellar protein FliO/FliZ
VGNPVLQIAWSILLFALVVFLAWLTTRLLGQQWGAGARRGRALSIREQTPIGKDRSIALVEVAGRLYLVGITGQGITLLDLITDPATVAQVQAATPSVPPLALGGMLQSFPALLQRRLGRPDGSAPREFGQGSEPGTAVDTLAEQLERLKSWRQAKK